ncbi:hypothetical protein BH20ACT23_BH20ACT23_03810 [soil metagenome]
MLRRMLVAFGIVALLATACGGDDGDPAAASGDGGGGGGTGSSSVTLTAADFSFDPGTVTAAAGDTIELSNEGESPRTYDFICKFHPEDMTGTLEITE